MLISFARRRRDRHRPGVPVRHELVGVLALRRRRLRRAAGDGGAGRVLPRVDVPRPVDLRPRPAVAARAPGVRSGWSPIGTMLSAYFILAANSWMQHPVGYRSTRRRAARELTSHLRRCSPTTPLLLRLPAHDPRRAADRRHGRRSAVCAWHLLRGQRRRRLRRARCASRCRRRCVAALGTGGRRPLPGHAAGRAAADEDGRRRGAVRAPRARAVLALRHRRLSTPNPRAHERRRPGPAPALAAGHRHLERQGQGHQRPQRASTAGKYGPGEYAPIVAITYWSLPRDGRRRAR